MPKGRPRSKTPPPIAAAMIEAMLLVSGTTGLQTSVGEVVEEEQVMDTVVLVDAGVCVSTAICPSDPKFRGSGMGSVAPA